MINKLKSRHVCSVLILALALGSLSACQEDSEGAQPALSAIEAPSAFPQLGFPKDNIPTLEKIELGRFLFYDKRLSGNESYSCGTCHQQELAFTDGLAVAQGATGEHHTLGSMSLTNIAYAATLGWGNPNLEVLEAQALIPMFGEEPIELGLNTITEAELLDRLKTDEQYPNMFKTAFPKDEAPISIGNIAKAIASFERTLLSADSPYDRYIAGDQEALNPQEKRGLDLFFSETLECFHCHGGFNFSDSVASPDFPFSEKPFHNNGMYNVANEGRYPKNQGTFEHTRAPEDLGRFKAPTLRNIAVTAPYLHDGSVATLSELIDLYANGGRVIESGDSAGDGTMHPNKSAFVSGFSITPEEKADLLAFLNALTDSSFLTNPKFSNPFED